MAEEVVTTLQDHHEFKSTLDAADSFLESERQYVEGGLRQCYETFYKRLNVHIKQNKTILEQSDIFNLFSNIETIYTANNKLYSDLMTFRMQGAEQLRDNFGAVMVDFIPYLKVYTDYIVKAKDRREYLEHLQQGNRKFREFLKINEACVKRKLKSLLDEPTSRLPQYLQQMADVYEAWERESGKESEGAKTLVKAIIDVQKMTDEIAKKCRDQKARRLVGRLQKDVFNNKIELTASHRYIVKHGPLKIIKKGSAAPHEFILCNDILVIGTQSSRWSSGQLTAVFPLIALRVLRNPNVDETLQTEAKFRFAVIPQNKNFTPSESGTMGSVVIITDSAESLEEWIEVIEDTVDEEEHNLRPCNPVDLEKRLRREKTSQEGMAATITITDPVKIKEIEEWKLLRESGHKPQRRPKSSDVGDAPTAAMGSGGPPPPPSKRGPPPRGGAPPPPNSGIGMPATPRRGGGGGPPPSGRRGPPPTRAKPTRRANLLAGINKFDKTQTLRRITDTDAPVGNIPAEPENLNSLLQNTLANYRNYVQGGDSDDDESDGDWE